MAKKTLTEAFEVKPKETPKSNLKDYDIFSDKSVSEEDAQTSKKFKNEHGFVPSDVWLLFISKTKPL